MNKTLVGVIVVVAVIAGLPLAARLMKGPSAPAATASASSTSGAPASNASDSGAVAKEVADALGRSDTASVVARFDDTMKGALPEAKLAETWNAVLAQAGTFKKQLRTRSETAQGMNVVVVTCEFERANLDIQVAVNPSGKVAGLFFRPAS